MISVEDVVRVRSEDSGVAADTYFFSIFVCCKGHC